MMRAEIMQPEQKQIAPKAWQLTEDRFDVEANSVQETLFSLGNGYLGLRGAHEEGLRGLAGKTIDATFINGFYEASPLHYPETGHAFAKVHQFMLNVPNAKCIDFSLGKEDFDFIKGKITNYKRSLDFRTGILSRNFDWTSPSNKTVSVQSQRLVSFANKNLFAIKYEITSSDFSGQITLRSAIDPQAPKDEDDGEPRYGAAVASVAGEHLCLLTVEQGEDFSAMVHRTQNSHLVLVTAVENEVVSGSGNRIRGEAATKDGRAEQVYKIEIKPGKTVTLIKYGVYFSSRDYAEVDLLPLAKAALKEARKLGFDGLCVEHKEYLSDFWHYADVEITGNDALQLGVRFNQFHLLQSIGRDGKTSIAAKGLTGEGYGGHVFWDAETYTLPFYLYTRPEIARKMLEYRYHTLNKARERAREMSHLKGALYAWRTIAGEECSAYFPGGTAQYHINADIAYAIKQYYEATGDEEFMRKYGAEIVMDTARIWADLGAYIPKKNNKFCINEVTGPNEYTAMVNNNFYTNSMAQTHLRFATELAAKFKRDYADDFVRIKAAMNLSDNEPTEWAKAFESMYLPYDEELGIHPQDDSFLYKKKWDFAEKPQDSANLPMHYHYLVIYRHQVCKQADVVLANFLLGDRFTLAEKKRDYDYYEAITTHDSSLSHCTFSVMASEVGYPEKAYQYFLQTALGDLDDLHGNTSYGVHVAAMAGTWMAVVNGFGGMRVYDSKLQFAPYLPSEWEHYSFRINFQSKLILVEVDKKQVSYRLLEGDSLNFSHKGTPIQLTKTDPVKAIPSSAENKATAVKIG